jgi:hypothetical protein
MPKDNILVSTELLSVRDSRYNLMNVARCDPQRIRSKAPRPISLDLQTQTQLTKAALQRHFHFQCSHKEKVSFPKALSCFVTYTFLSSINFNLNSFAVSMLSGNSLTSEKTLSFSSALSFPRALPLREN